MPLLISCNPSKYPHYLGEKSTFFLIYSSISQWYWVWVKYPEKIFKSPPILTNPMERWTTSAWLISELGRNRYIVQIVLRDSFLMTTKWESLLGQSLSFFETCSTSFTERNNINVKCFLRNHTQWLRMFKNTRKWCAHTSLAFIDCCRVQNGQIEAILSEKSLTMPKINDIMNFWSLDILSSCKSWMKG